MQIQIDVLSELRRSFEYEPKPVQRLDAPAFYYRFDGGQWNEVHDEHGRERHVGGLQFVRPDIPSSFALRRAIEALDGVGADVFELATAPNDAKIFHFDAAPKCKGAPVRTLMLRPLPTPPGQDPWQTEDETFRLDTRPTVQFRTIERLVWAWGRLGLRPSRVYEIASNGGTGDLVWEPPPREVEVPCPVELVSDEIARDRYLQWAAIAKSMFAQALETKLLADIDLQKISEAAYRRHKETFREVELPELVTKWSPDAQAIFRAVHEGLCAQGLQRHSVAVDRAIESIATERAALLKHEIMSGAIAL